MFDKKNSAIMVVVTNIMFFNMVNTNTRKKKGN